MNARAGGNMKFFIVKTGYKCDTATNTNLMTAAYEAIHGAQDDIIAANDNVHLGSSAQIGACVAGNMVDPDHQGQLVLNQIGEDVAVAAAAYA